MVWEVAVGKALASGAGKTLGWVSEAARGKIADARAAKRLDLNEPSIAELRVVVQQLTPGEAAAMAQLIESPEVANIVYQIATKQLLRRQGEDADTHDQLIRDELEGSIQLILPGHPLAYSLADALFRVLVQSVQENLKVITPEDQSGISPAARAAIIRSAADMTTASGVNLAILSRLSDLSAIHQFEVNYQTAVANLNSKMRLPHAGTSRQVPYSQLFVQSTIARSLSETDQLEQEDADEHEDTSLADLASIIQRFVLLGDPGGGKTTSTSQLLHQIASGNASQILATVPFWITLRDFARRFDNGISIVDYIEEQCRSVYSITPPPDAIEYILLNGRGIVFFDGLDELLDTSHRQRIVLAVEGFASRYATASVIVTSRRIGYNEAALDDNLFTKLQLGKFNDDQIETYAAKWFALDDSIEPARKQMITEAFMTDSGFVRDLTSNPLMLSLMCGIYAFENYIPRNRPDVYERCALLLFEKWDKQRGIEGEMSFDAHVQSAIRSIAFSLYSAEGLEKGLSRYQLVKHVKDYLLQKRFDDEAEAEQAANEFIDFCKGRAWVLTELGVDVYGFTHRTFLEYFAASHLVRLKPSADSLLSELYSHLRKSEWDVVAQLALQILGKTVDDGADDFLDALIDRSAAESESLVRESLLGFAVRALSFIVPRPSVLRKIVDSVVDFHCAFSANFAEPRSTSVAGNIVFVSPENRPLVSKYFLERVKSRLESNHDDERALALAWYLVLHGSSVAPAMPDEFWSMRMAEYRGELKGYVAESAQQHSWAASILVESGELSPEDMISTLGPRSIFDLSVAGDLLVAPISYRLVNMPFEETIGVTEGVYRGLLSAPRPWFTSSESFDFVSYDMDFFFRRKERIDGREVIDGNLTQKEIFAYLAATLCWIAVVELAITHSSDESAPEYYSYVRDIPRKRDEVLNQWLTMSIDFNVNVPDDFEDFLRQWAFGNIDLVAQV